jgi:ribonuclease HI
MGTNQKAELLAIREALMKVRDRPNTIVRVHTDSAYAIGCISKDWKVKTNKELVDEVRRLAAECADFQIRKVPGHSGVPANERADELAVRAALHGERYSGS